VIIRIFRAKVHDGKQADFERFFLDTAVPHVRKQSGLISLGIGRPESSTPDEFVMIMRWKDLDSVKEFAGADWQSAVILEEERHLIREVSVHHYEYVTEEISES